VCGPSIKRTGVVGVDCEGMNMVGVDWEFKKRCSFNGS
jgi:hypothetical protein